MHLIKLTNRKISDLKKDKEDLPKELFTIIDFDNLVKIEESVNGDCICITTLNNEKYVESIKSFEDSVGIDWLKRMYSGSIISTITKPIMPKPVIPWDKSRNIIIVKKFIDIVKQDGDGACFICLKNNDSVTVDMSMDELIKKLGG